MNQATDILDILKQELRGPVIENHPLAPLTSYRIGGPAKVWLEPVDEEDVQAALQIIHESGLPLFVMGWGSNLLVSDAGFDGVVLALRKNLSGIRIDGPVATGFAGEMLIDLIRETAANGLGGMEQMAGIPGGIGGGLRMNAGAFGQEIEALTLTIKGYTLTGESVLLHHDEVGFGYRSAPALENVVVTSARFRFEEAEKAALEARIQDILSIRATKQPLEYPSCGSVFKRPKGYYAGALIEEIGMKGKGIGGAMVSEKHAGFIVNRGDATAQDVLAVIHRIEEEVERRFGVHLEREVKLVGFTGDEAA